jgi:competence protein ComEC
LALGVAAALLWSAAYLTPPRGVLRVAVLDVGQGDAILVTSPSGRQVLVDGGPDPAATLRALGRHVPFWDKTLDIVVLTHPDADHVGGLAGVVGRYRPGLVLERRSADTVVAQQWERAASNSKARRVVAEAGQRISLGDGAALEVLWPSASWADAPAVADNNAGVVLRVTYGQAAVLLAADIEAPAERALVASGTTLQAQALKVPHHGSRTSTSPALLEAAAPLVAVISAGRDNRFGHPHAEVVERLVQAINVGGVVSTAERGDVVFTTDGARLWIATQR